MIRPLFTSYALIVGILLWHFARADARRSLQSVAVRHRTYVPSVN